MYQKKTFIIVSLIVFLFSGGSSLAACPSADLNGDCRVDMDDFAIMASQWLDEFHPDPNGMEWVYIEDDGSGMKDENGDPISMGGFNGYMSKYETTNAQYCQFLNAALASGDIYVSNNRVYGANGSNGGADFVDEIYFETYAYSQYSQIAYSGGVFSVRSRDGHSMNSHPVVKVSWYGAMAFAGYYGWRLPTKWEWQAVADFNGSYNYGCGTTIDHSKANYAKYNPLGLSSYPYTSPVDYYSSYGYGMNDMAGNAWEWTSSLWDPSYSYRVIHGGSWFVNDYYCTVSNRTSDDPGDTSDGIGFRVCR